MKHLVTLGEQMKGWEEGTYRRPDGINEPTSGFTLVQGVHRGLHLSAKRLAVLVKAIVTRFDIDVDKHFCTFNRMKPLERRGLFDIARICDIETGDVKVAVTLRSPFSRRSEVWSASNEFREPIFDSEDIDGLLRLIEGKDQ